MIFLSPFWSERDACLKREKRVIDGFYVCLFRTASFFPSHTHTPKWYFVFDLCLFIQMNRNRAVFSPFFSFFHCLPRLILLWVDSSPFVFLMKILTLNERVKSKDRKGMREPEIDWVMAKIQQQQQYQQKNRIQELVLLAWWRWRKKVLKNAAPDNGMHAKVERCRKRRVNVREYVCIDW